MELDDDLGKQIRHRKFAVHNEKWLSLIDSPEGQPNQAFNEFGEESYEVVIDSVGLGLRVGVFDLCLILFDTLGIDCLIFQVS